ncbi:MAG: hypothetical protein OEU92_20955 [Alphaproteobacteria bacterium]|nr:hypothetical protein [Alphaproteobacteria bacterium]
MTTIFLSGSRSIRSLQTPVVSRLNGIVDKGFDIVVGDAAGADIRFQSLLNGWGFRAVTVFVSGHRCRNNVGDWPVQNVPVDPSLRGRAFYTVKDRRMAAIANFGFVLWDGRSPGSLNNCREVVRQGKKALVHTTRTQRFIVVKTAGDVDRLQVGAVPA